MNRFVEVKTDNIQSLHECRDVKMGYPLGRSINLKILFQRLILGWCSSSNRSSIFSSKMVGRYSSHRQNQTHIHIWNHMRSPHGRSHSSWNSWCQKVRFSRGTDGFFWSFDVTYDPRTFTSWQEEPGHIINFMIHAK